MEYITVMDLDSDKIYGVLKFDRYLTNGEKERLEKDIVYIKNELGDWSIEEVLAQIEDKYNCEYIELEDNYYVSI